MGQGWSDVTVWEANNLLVSIQPGEWANAFKKIAKGNRGVHYFSRSLDSAVATSIKFPILVPEKKLCLIYDIGWRFYLSHNKAHYKTTIEDSLHKAKKSGLLDRLITKHYKKDLIDLKFKDRVKIVLKTP